MDPLRCLQEFYSNGTQDQIVFIDNNTRVKFGEKYELEIDKPTRFKSSLGAPYPLGALLLYMQCSTLSSKDYLERASQAGIERVSRIDQQALRDFLEGRRNEQDTRNITIELAAPSTSVAASAPKRPRTQPAQLDTGAHERSLRRRENLLMVSGKDFSKAITLFKSTEAALHAEKKHDKARKNGAAPAPKAAAHAPRGGSRLDRGPAAPSDKQAQLGLNVFGAASAQQGRPRADSHGTRPGAAPGRPTNSSGRASDLKRPIIIVPQGESSMIGILNAPQLLRDGRFVTTAEARAAGAKAANPVIIAKPRSVDPKRPTMYEITDLAPSKHSERWTRVVAIVCLGKKWQFAGFPFKGAEDGNTVAMFSSICGFYFHYRDENVPDTVSSWNVKCLELDRNNRHHDSHTSQVVFDTIAKFLDSRRNVEPTSKFACRPTKLAYK